jgi:hypothetical protein
MKKSGYRQSRKRIAAEEKLPIDPGLVCPAEKRGDYSPGEAHSQENAIFSIARKLKK